MRKWLVSLTVLGMGGLNWLLVTEAGRRAVRAMVEATPSDELQAFNDAVQGELARLQAAVDQVAASLQAAES